MPIGTTLAAATKDLLERANPGAKLAGLGDILDELLGGAAYDPGRRAINVLRIASNVADEETVTIGSVTYEFDRAGDGVATAGAVPVTGHADDTPANATDALIAAINANGGEPVSAIDISDNEVLIVVDQPGNTQIACSDTLAGANNGWAAAATYGGRDPGARRVSLQQRVPNSTEVALGNMHFLFDFQPSMVLVLVAPTDTPGKLTAWDGAVSISGNRVTVDNSGVTDWAGTDTVTVIAID